MSEQNTTTGDPGRSGASESEQPRRDERCGFDMERVMTRMMAHCPCGPEMMAKMAEMMGSRLSKPTGPAQEQE